MNIVKPLQATSALSILRRASCLADHHTRIIIAAVTASCVVAGIDRVTTRIVSLSHGAVYHETKYWRLRLSCCNKLLTILQVSSSS